MPIRVAATDDPEPWTGPDPATRRKRCPVLGARVAPTDVQRRSK